jgi:hypothetical protein
MAQSKNITQVYGALKLMYALDNNGARLINIADPVDPQDAVSKIFLENSINAQILTAGTGISILSNTINVNENQPQIIGVGNVNSGTWSADTISISYGGTGNTNFPSNKLVIGNGSNPLTTTAYLDYDDNYFTSSVPIVISDSTNASGNSLGSLYIAGGVNIRKDLIVNGTTVFTDLSLNNIFANQRVSTSSLNANNSTIGEIVVTSLLKGNDIIANTISASSLSVENNIIVNSTINSLYSSTISVGNLTSTNISSVNLVSTNGSISNLNTNIHRNVNQTSTNLLVTSTGSFSFANINTCSTGNLIVLNSSIANSIIASSNLINTNITTANVLIMSVGNFVSTNATMARIECSNNVSTIATIGTMRVSGTSTTLNGIVTNSTINNLVNSNITTSNLQVNTLISSSNIFSTNSTMVSLVSTNLTASNVNVVNNLRIGNDLFVSGTVTAVNITSINLIQNNITVASLLATNITTSKLVATDTIITNASIGILNAFGNSNTVGSLFTTGGNIGIGTNIPSNTLHVNGSLRVTGLITASNVIATNVTSNNLVTTNITANGIVSLRSTRGILIGTSIDLDGGRFISALDSGLPTNTTRWITWGQGASNYNQAELGFNYIASGNTANSLVLGLYGEEKMRIQANGFVGVGANSPNYKLDILDSSTIDTVRIQNNNASGYASIVYEANNTAWFSGVGGSSATFANKFYIANNSGAKFVGQINGNWGINEDSPTNTLHINGDLRVNGLITSASLLATNASLANVISTNISSSTLNVIGVTTSSLNANNITTSNVMSTNISSSTLNVISVTTASLLATNFSSSNLTVTNLTADGIVSLKSTRGILIGTSTQIDSESFISALDSDMPNGSTRRINCGQGASTNNQSELGFKYVGPGNTANSLLLGLYGNERMRIQATGNIGISEEFPTNSLHVNGSLRVNGLITVSNLVTTNITSTNSIVTTLVAANISVGSLSASTLVLSGELYATNIKVIEAITTANLRITNAQNRSLILADLDIQGTWAIGANNNAMQYQVGAGASGAHVFYTNSTSGTSNEAMGTERMRITGSGNIGIGENSPSYKLDILASNVGDTVRIQNNNASGFAATRYVANGATWISGVGGSNTAEFANKFYLIGPNSGFFGLTNGNWGINLNNPTNSLHINGSLRVTDLITTSNLIASNITSNSLVTTNISTSNLTSNNLVTTNISTGVLNATGITIGNINITGGLFQNGNPYIASQWTTVTPESISYYSSAGNVYVGINNTNASYSLDVTGDSRFRNGLSTGNINVNGDMVVSGNFSIANLNLGDVTTGNIITNNINYGVADTYSGSFIAANNVISSSSITGLSFVDTSAFTVNLNVIIERSIGGNLYAYFLLEGIHKDGTWSLLKSYSGDSTGITFSITSDGQINYTSTNLTNWTSTTFRFIVNKISNTGTYVSLLNNTQGSYIFNTLQINDTTASIIGSNNGSLYSRGGATFDKNITIRDTNNSTAIGSGGCLTVLGGTSISKDLYIGENVYVARDLLANGLNLGLSSYYSGAFLASNNTTLPTNVNNLLFNEISSFTVNLNITLIKSIGSNLYSYFILEGIKNDSGWSLLTSYSGDDTGVIFTITSNGQIQYTSTNISNWVSNTFRYNVSQISNTGTYSSLQSPTQGSYQIDTIQLNNTTSSIIGTSNGALYSLGGATFEKSVSIKSTINSSGVETGGSLTVLGGASISKNVYMGSNLIVTGDITAFGTISDSRFKSDIQNLTNGLDIINKLRPVTFTWNNEIYNQEFKGREDVGFIAQEVEKIIPYAVDDFSYSEDGELYKKMRHERIIPYLVEAIKVLTKKVNFLEEQLNL